jgi:hypothetical protein
MLREFVGDQFANAIGGFDDLNFRRTAPPGPRPPRPVPDQVTPTLTQKTRPT